jgi:hypothetical protein
MLAEISGGKKQQQKPTLTIIMMKERTMTAKNSSLVSVLISKSTVPIYTHTHTRHQAINQYNKVNCINLPTHTYQAINKSNKSTIPV